MLGHAALASLFVACDVAHVSTKPHVLNADNAAVDARKCCQLLMESEGRKLKAAHDAGETGEFELPPLVWKNWWRLARALHFGGAPDAEVHYVLHLMDKGGSNGEWSKKASEMRDNLEYYRGESVGLPPLRAGAGKTFEPSLLRASFQNPYVEYYNFGHDVSESLLVRNESNEAQSIRLADLTDKEISSLAFLFGGVGDGRHVMATLLDAHHQYRSLPPSQQEKFRLHMTLNDISGQLLAKDVLVLALAHEVGKLADDVDSALTTRDPFVPGMVIYYVTLGYVMPPFVHKKFIEYVKEWFTENSREEFQKTFPGLVISEKTWEGMLVRMRAWIDPDTHYSPPLKSAKAVLAHYKPSGDDAMDNAMSGLGMMGAGNDMMLDMQARMEDAKAKRRAQMLEEVKTMELSPMMVELGKKMIGEDATEDQIREFIAESAADSPHTADTDILTSDIDKLFLETTHALYPQHGPVEEINEEELRESENSKSGATEAFQKFQSKIWKDWVANPVQQDPLYWHFLDGIKESDDMNPVREFPKDYFTDEVISFMSDPPHTKVSTAEERKKFFQSNTLAFNLIRYYWHVGKALSALSDKITLEIDLGSVIGLGPNAENRQENGLPTKYHRITLSNIPDYTGMLSVFITLAPMMATKSESITPCLQSNCLLNTGLWKTYDDYVFSTTCLGYKEAEAIFRLRVTAEEPSTWDHFTVWEQVATPHKNLPVSYESLRQWLHRLYLSIVLPPDRDPSSVLREERPSNVNLFLLTLSSCVERLGVPPHFVASVIEDLLQKDKLVTKATLSNDSPASALSRNNVSKKVFNLTAFRAELGNQVAMLMQSNMLGVKLLATNNLPSGNVTRYELKIDGISRPYSCAWTYGGFSGASSLGFMLAKSSEVEFDICTGASSGRSNPMFMMMSMMNEGRGGMPSSTKTSELRQALLSSGDDIGHVFSCMEWDLDTQTVTFWMCDDLFDKFKSYHFKLIRVDGWFTLPHDEALLGDATRID